jgi:taurine dioxygenase
MTTAGNITIQPVTASIGAVLGGVDLRRELSVEVAAAVRQAVLDHGVVFLRDQDITLEQFWAFMENFGQPLKEESDGTDDDKPSDVMTASLTATRYSAATWHADTTALAKPPIATALRMVEPPPVGGDTCWSSMYAAYEALSEPIKAMLGGLSAVRSIQKTIDSMSEYAGVFEERYTARHRKQQVHPVVLTHPETGRKALYVSETFTTRIVELSAAESAAVLSVLFRHVESPFFTVRWKWTAGDIAFWDNRSTQHFAVPDYDAPRVVQRIVLAGARPGEASMLAPRGTIRKVA